MSCTNSYRKYAYGSATMVAAYLVSLIAWLDNTGVISLMPRSFVGHPIEVWIATAFIVIDIPGWFIVAGFKANDLATRLTDILIPILSGAFWGLLVILVTKLIKLLLRYARPKVR